MSKAPAARPEVARPVSGDVMKEAALACVGRGWSVVPMHSPRPRGCSCRRPECPSPGKHPRLRWAAATRVAATAKQVDMWWSRWPDANVAVATGLVSGVVVIDVDPRHRGDDALAELQGVWGEMPDTLESRTGGGGRHLWFAAPASPLPSVELSRGVELKAEGGLVVVPPSQHASGLAYEWVNQDGMTVAPPGWVAGLAHGRLPAPGHGRPEPTRTESERSDFAAAWSRLGITVEAGDAYYLCPFHDDHHPSLHIDAAGCRWYCFGCGVGGGIGSLRRKLGDTPPSVPRRRLRGWVGPSLPVTLEGEAEVAVVGESFHQEELLALAGGVRRYGGVELEAAAELVPVEGNGTEVRIDGSVVGYLRAEDRDGWDLQIRESIARHGTAVCRARIRGGWERGADDVGLFGVTLRLPS